MTSLGETQRNQKLDKLVSSAINKAESCTIAGKLNNYKGKKSNIIQYIMAEKSSDDKSGRIPTGHSNIKSSMKIPF